MPLLPGSDANKEASEVLESTPSAIDAVQKSLSYYAKHSWRAKVLFYASETALLIVAAFDTRHGRIF